MADRFSFETIDALDYEELRPGYAPDAITWVAERGGIVPGSRVVDLAAGTGQLSRRFVSLGVDVVAVEPAANMRAMLEERLPQVGAVEGTAESIPLDEASVDAVVVGDAFHHFAREAAFAEIRRILRPGETGFECHRDRVPHVEGAAPGRDRIRSVRTAGIPRVAHDRFGTDSRSLRDVE